jgi:uncharacterized protein with PQ loop repeat
VLTTLLGTLATCFTVGRTWPQFLRIVIRKDQKGVSLATWSIALTNHTGWLVYGILTTEVIFIISNTLAAIGCAATVCVLHAWRRMAQIAIISAVISVGIYGIAASLLLAVITGVTLTVVLPQLVAVFRSPASGVSTLAWIIAACSSITWIAWAVSIDRLTVVIAHFVMLPSAVAIAIRAARAHSHVQPAEEQNDVAAATAP